VPLLVLFVPQPSTERLEMMTVLRMDMQGPHYQGNSSNMHLLQETITIQTNFILYSCMRNENLSKTNFLSLNESKQQTVIKTC